VANYYPKLHFAMSECCRHTTGIWTKLRIKGLRGPSNWKMFYFKCFGYRKLTIYYNNSFVDVCISHCTKLPNATVQAVSIPDSFNPTSPAFRAKPPKYLEKSLGWCVKVIVLPYVQNNVQKYTVIHIYIHAYIYKHKTCTYLKLKNMFTKVTTH
jgi:hypothetical protein